MKYKFLQFVIYLFISEMLPAQKVSLMPFIGFHYSNIDYVKKSDSKQSDFKTTSPKIAELWGLSVSYKTKKYIQQISIQNVVIGEAFQFKNKYLFTAPDNLLGTYKVKNIGGGDYLVLKCSICKIVRENKNYSKRLHLKWDITLGSGIIFDRTQNYYDSTFGAIYWSVSGGGSGGNYWHYESTLKKHSYGMVASVGIGVTIYKKNKKPFLYAELFYNQGLKQMLQYSINYKYGYTQYPQYQTSVTNQIIRTRGTNFGLKIGVPIKIRK